MLRLICPKLVGSGRILLAIPYSPAMTNPEPQLPAPRWPAYLTAAAAVVAAASAGLCAVFIAVGVKSVGLAFEGGSRPMHQVVCTAYSDFVLTQAHNGYTAEQIEKVLIYAASHAPAEQTVTITPPPEPASPTAAPPTAVVTPSAAAPSTTVIPNRYPEKGPLLADEKMCGTPAEVLKAAGVQPPAPR